MRPLPLDVSEVDQEDSLDCEELAVLEEQGRYRRYIGTVEAALLGWNSESLHDAEHSELKQKLWRQLVVVCNCFATRLIEKRTYPKAMGKSPPPPLLPCIICLDRSSHVA